VIFDFAVGRSEGNRMQPGRYLAHCHAIYLKEGFTPMLGRNRKSRILRIFKRKAHLFLPNPPSEDDSFEWLSIMQHHGTPTRLLDFTWSPHVAAFFALEAATDTAAIWALFPPGLSRRRVRTTRASQKIDKDELGPWKMGNYERYFLPNKTPMAFIGEPHRMNSRLIAQSGTFAMPGILDKPLEEILQPSTIVRFENRRTKN
jgi:hypothetical protein